MEISNYNIDINTCLSRNPVACGVTSLGMDHVSTLGGTIESIAWQKAGIFKVHVIHYSYLLQYNFTRFTFIMNAQKGTQRTVFLLITTNCKHKPKKNQTHAIP